MYTGLVGALRAHPPMQLAEAWKPKPLSPGVGVSLHIWGVYVAHSLAYMQQQYIYMLIENF